MDNATVLKILQNYGAPPTPENINKVLSMATQDSELLGRSMGLQGGGDMAGPRADLMLDKMAASTERAPMQRSRQANYGEGSDVINPNSESNGTAQNGSARGVAPARRGVAPNTEPPPGSMPIPTSAAPRNTNTNSGGKGIPDVALTDGMPAGVVEGGATAPSGSGGNGLNLPQWLLAALGFTAGGALSQFKGAPSVPNTTPQIEGANPKQKQIGYEQKLEDKSPYPKTAGGANKIEQKDVERTKGMAQTPEDIARLQAEIDAENAAMDEGARKAMPQKKQPARPEFTSQEMLMEAVKNFQKMFRR